MAHVKLAAKGNRGHNQKWHASTRWSGDEAMRYGPGPWNCPCKGRPQKPSKRLEARIADYETTHLEDLPGYHKPGSQNRKK